MDLLRIRHATEWHGATPDTCRMSLVDTGSMTLDQLVALVRRAGFKSSDARLELQHEQGSAYVSGSGDDSWADVDSCTYSVDLVFPASACKHCQQKLRVREAALVKRKADRKTARQRRSAA